MKGSFGPLRLRLVGARSTWARLVLAAFPLLWGQAQEAPTTGVPTPDAVSTMDGEAGQEAPWWTAELEAVLAGLDDHPALLATAASVEAARRELEAVRFPVSVEAAVSGTRLDTSPPSVPLPPPYEGTVPDPGGWSSQASVSARFRPFVAGDVADLEAQRRIALERAERTWRETRANLEAAAVQAAAGVTLAGEAERLAAAGLDLARRSAHATELRAQRGAATPRERERSALDLARAEERLSASRAALAEARANLAALTGGEAGLSEIPLPPVVRGEPPAVAEARADLVLAGVGLGRAERALLPTAHAAYAWNADGGAVSVSIETRTFEPTLTYETPGPFESGATSLLPPEARPTVDGSLTLGLQMSISAEGYYARDAAEARRSAAAAGVEAARSDAALSALSRDEAVRAARMELAFARQERALVRAETEDARMREDLGLEVPLVVAREELALQQAELAVLNARADLLSALLRGYRELAVPLSEARP